VAGLLASLFNRGAVSEADPNPGIGGYTSPRGPDGYGGYPGSTSATRENPQAAPDLLQNAPDRPQQYYGRPVVRRRPPVIGAQQADVIPPPAVRGSLPFGGADGKVNPDRARDTEQRPRVVTSTGTPGAENQRNGVYYGGRQAVPGAMHSYRSSPRGRHFPVDNVEVPSRYVFGGVNGGTDALDDTLQARRMPYTGHGGSLQAVAPSRGNKGIRGAVLDGNRFYQEPAGFSEGDQGGSYGKARTTQRHRPTIFSEPAPWSAGYYDTTANAGGPDTPGTNTQVVQSVHVSPSAERRGWRRG
jgi:hypothetical protein